MIKIEREIRDNQSEIQGFQRNVMKSNGNY